MGSLKEKATEYKREELRSVLMQCTPEQIDVFNRMYGSIGTIPEHKMNRAYDQCVRTIEKNKSEKSIERKNELPA